MRNMNSEKKIVTIVIPVFNEEEIIESFTGALLEVMSGLPIVFEIIFVDDGSSDNSPMIIRRMMNGNPNIKLVSFTRNFGHQFALWAGLDRSSGDAVIMMDSDLQHPPSLIPTLLEKWEDGALIVQTVRKDVDVALFKKWTSVFFYRILNFFSDVKLITNTADFRLIDRTVVNELLRFKEGDLFLRGLLPWLGHQTAFVEFVVEPRAGGRSKYSIIRMMKFAISGVTSFSTAPLKITAFIGIVISLASFYLGAASIYTRIFTDQAVPGWASVMVGVFFLGGLSMIFMGILGEYLGKIFLEVKNRPKYIVKETKGFDDRG